jgi:release factor glutamine methyltransferase
VDGSDVVAALRGAGCVFAEDEARVLMGAATSPAELAAMVDRRVGGLPLEHVLGWADFCGVRIALDPGVFVPRRRSEFLVAEAAAILGRERGETGELVRADGPVVVVDLCCGSGAVGAAVAAELGGVEIYAVDVDPAAARCARRNLPDGRVFEGDLYEPLPTSLRGRVDVLVANAPYVPTDAVGLLPPEARTYEPRVALDGGEDGLEVVRRVAAAAARWLTPSGQTPGGQTPGGQTPGGQTPGGQTPGGQTPGGHLLVETSADQAPAAVEAFVRGGLVPRVARSEPLDATVVIGTMPDGPASG